MNAQAPLQFKPLNTSDGTASYRKTLLYAHHGWGKTTQAKYYKAKYGKGLILSGESGLSSIASEGIDYFPFSSWNGESSKNGGTYQDPDLAHNPEKGVYSFLGLMRILNSDWFKQQGYKWIMVDSLTELSDMAFRHADAKETAKPTGKDSKYNGFAVWEEYGAGMIGACKWIRDLPMHVIITALAKEGDDDNGNKDIWPMVKGKQVQQQLPGIFDCVLCGMKGVEKQVVDGSVPKVTHCIVTDEWGGWHGKVRDEKRRLRPIERADSVITLFEKMEMADEEFAKLNALKQQPQGGK